VIGSADSAGSAATCVQSSAGWFGCPFGGADQRPAGRLPGEPVPDAPHMGRGANAIARGSGSRRRRGAPSDLNLLSSWYQVRVPPGVPVCT
jgi:hypothetical protein